MEGFDTGGMNVASTRHYVADIAAEAERVVATIEKMRSLLRNVQTKVKPTHLPSVVGTALLYLKGFISGHHIQLEEKGLSQSLIIPGDEAQLNIAVINLIRNAVEAIAHHGGDKRIIRVELIKGPGTVKLVIGDSGPGLPADWRNNEPLNTSKPNGTGIGLFLVRSTMENHHGQIKTGSSPLGGAEFRLIFPI
jgi:signal transduction histidine kinase